MTSPDTPIPGSTPGHDAALDAFFSEAATAVEPGTEDAALGRPGELEHEQFSGPRFVRVVVMAAWGVSLALASTLRWGHTRFAAPGVARWTLAFGALVCLAAAVWISTRVREAYLPPDDEDPEFVELRAGFRERFVVGPGDMTWALLTLAPLMVLWLF